MASLSDVRRLARALSETSERNSHGNVAWAVRVKVFAWERPLRASDIAAVGKDAPTGKITTPKLQAALLDAWLVRAPERVAAELLSGSR